MSGDLKEALTAAGVSALIQKQIDPMLLEYQRRYSPLVRSLPSQKWGSTVYYFNQRNARMAGGFVSDGGARPVTSSTYVQNSFTMRNLQSVGSVTGYAEEVTQDLMGSLRAAEIEGGVQGLLWDMETAILWGCDPATGVGPYPQFSGLDSLVSTFSGTSQNAIDLNGALTLSSLDQLIDLVETQAAMPTFASPWMLVGSNTAWSKIAQLFTNQQRFLDKVEVATGLIVPSYRDIPLIKSSFLSTRAITMGTVTSANATTGGSLGNTLTYKYVVAAVIARSGETVASAEVSQATGATSTNVITLSFSTPTGLDGAQPILYKVYRTAAGGATGTETLLGVVDANVGLAADGVTPVLTTSITDDGVKLTPMNGATAPASNPAAYVGTNTSLKPLAANQENIYLVSRDRNFVVRPYVRDVRPIDVYPTTAAPDTLPFALVSDTTLALRAPKYAGRLARVTATL